MKLADVLGLYTPICQLDGIACRALSAFVHKMLHYLHIRWS